MQYGPSVCSGVSTQATAPEATPAGPASASVERQPSAASRKPPKPTKDPRRVSFVPSTARTLARERETGLREQLGEPEVCGTPTVGGGEPRVGAALEQ